MGAYWLIGPAALLLGAPLAAQTPITADPSEVPEVDPEPFRPEDSLGRDEARADVGRDLPPATDEQIEFSADTITYDAEADVVTASGRVRLTRAGNVVRADSVTWDRATGRVTAEGQVVAVSPGGDTVYGDGLELADDLRDGVVQNLLLVLADGSRLAAQRGTRAGDLYRLDRAAYTACPVVGPAGCPREPSWSLTAVEVVFDRSRRRVRYRGARLNLLGVLSIPLPGLAHSVGDGQASGLLLPDVGVGRSNGFEYAQPYYLRLASDRDLTVTPHLYTGTLPMLQGRYRELTGNGAYQVEGFATYSRQIPLNPRAATAGDSQFRGYVDASGRFVLSPSWTVGGSIRRTTDRTFLRRYDISRDNRLRSVLEAERLAPDSYLSIAGWATQELRTGFTQGQQPLALPAIDGRLRLRGPARGIVTLQVNSLGILRTDGQDMARAFALARWERRALTPLGQQLTLTGLARTDLYWTADSALTTVPSYRGTDGFSGRAIGLLAADLQWPFAGPLGGGRQRITPRAQLVATPPIRNLSLPNEDSRAFELEDVNIFSLNRFPGYDRFEDGVRLTLGADYQFARPGFQLDSQLAQSFRLSRLPSLFPDGTGLTDTVSDVVGRTTVRWRDRLALTHRFRLDHETFEVRRNEVDLTAGSRRTFVTLGYLRLNRNLRLEDLADREEARAGVRVAFGPYWSAFGSAVIDLTDRREDLLSRSDGFQPIRHRLGVLYADECLSLGLTWRRDYVRQGDSRAGNSFQLTFALRNLGV